MKNKNHNQKQIASGCHQQSLQFNYQKASLAMTLKNNLILPIIQILHLFQIPGTA